MHPPLGKDWQWEDPPEGVRLRVLTDADGSRLIIPTRRTSFEIIGSVAGYATLAGAVAIVIAWLFSRAAEAGAGGLVAMLVGAGLLVWAGWLLLHADSKLLWITLQPDAAIFTLRIGIGLHRHVRLSRKRARRATFETRMQSHLAMATGQSTPLGYLELKSVWRRRKFVLDADPDALVWVRGGLERWQSQA